MPVNNSPDTLYLVSVSAMLVCDEADIVPTVSVVGHFDLLNLTQISSIVEVLDKACDFKDAPMTNIRPMTKEEVIKWRKDREDAHEDLETTVKLFP